MNKAATIVEQAEVALRDLLADAARTGDYPAVVRIAAWARTIHDLRSTTGNTGESSASLDLRRTRTRQKPRPEGQEDRKAAAVRRHQETDYPKFLRHKDELIRLAWSKRDNKEYHHKASYSVLRALTSAMIERGADGRVFSTDELLPIRNPADGNEVPNYQAYVGIALLKRTGLIDQHGRRGYSIPRLTDFENSVENVWKQLPTH